MGAKERVIEKAGSFLPAYATNPLVCRFRVGFSESD